MNLLPIGLIIFVVSLLAFFAYGGRKGHFKRDSVRYGDVLKSIVLLSWSWAIAYTFIAAGLMISLSELVAYCGLGFPLGLAWHTWMKRKMSSRLTNNTLSRWWKHRLSPILFLSLFIVIFAGNVTISAYGEPLLRLLIRIVLPLVYSVPLASTAHLIHIRKIEERTGLPIVLTG